MSGCNRTCVPSTIVARLWTIHSMESILISTDRIYRAVSIDRMYPLGRQSFGTIDILDTYTA
jgi:hypothetical protein